MIQQQNDLTSNSTELQSNQMSLNNNLSKLKPHLEKMMESLESLSSLAQEVESLQQRVNQTVDHEMQKYAKICLQLNQFNINSESFKHELNQFNVKAFNHLALRQKQHQIKQKSTQMKLSSARVVAKKKVPADCNEKILVEPASNGDAIHAKSMDFLKVTPECNQHEADSWPEPESFESDVGFKETAKRTLIHSFDDEDMMILTFHYKDHKKRPKIN